MLIRNLVVFMLLVTVIAPIVLYTDRLANVKFSSEGDLVEGFATSSFKSNFGHLNLIDGKSSSSVREPVAIIYSDNKSHPDSTASVWQGNDGIQGAQSLGVIERKSTRVLSIERANIIPGNPNSSSEKNSKVDDPNAIMREWR